MTPSFKSTLFSAFTAILLFFACSATANEALLKHIGSDMDATEPLIPSTARIEEKREGYFAKKVGSVDLVQGEAWVMSHNKPEVVYKLSQGETLFQSDVLFTGKSSNLQILLNDDSSVGLDALSRLRLSRIKFDTATKERDTEVKLDRGKARFKVTKHESMAPNFVIRTSNAVSAVRGSDFVVSTFDLGSGEYESFVVTGVDTVVDFASGAQFHEGKFVQIGPLSSSQVKGAKDAGAPIYHGKAALAVLTKVAPNLVNSANMEMPANFQRRQ